jgi:WD40 repeat protein
VESEWSERSGRIPQLPNAWREGDIVSIDGSHLLFLPADQPPQWLDLKGEHPAVTLSEIATSSQFLGCFGSNTLCYWNGTNHNQMVIAELRGTQVTQLSAFPTASGSQPTSVAFNSTRQLLAWTEVSASSVYVANLATLGRRVELRCDTPERRSLSFSEDGKYLLALARQKESLRAWQFLRLWDGGWANRHIHRRVDKRPPCMNAGH